jgi:hypothetical protein
MVLHKSRFSEIILEKENSLIIDKFLPETETMNNDEFKKEMNAFAEKVKEHEPERELVHLLDMNYVIDPDMQEWMNKKIFPKYENIIKRMAFLVPKEIFTQASVEQTMEDEAGQKFVQRFFEDEQEARKWLMES